MCSNTISTGPVYSDPVQHSNERVENIIGCCGIHIGTNPRNSSVTNKSLSTPQINMACCEKSEMSMLSLSATKNVTNDLTLFFSWLSKFTDMSETLSAHSISRQANISKNFSFSEHTISAAFRMHIFTNSPSQYGFDANAKSLAIM